MATTIRFFVFCNCSEQSVAILWHSLTTCRPYASKWVKVGLSRVAQKRAEAASRHPENEDEAVNANSGVTEQVLND